MTDRRVAVAVIVVAIALGTLALLVGGESTPPVAREIAEERNTRQQQHFLSIAKRLSRSDDAENVLAAALLLQGDLGSVALDTLERALPIAPVR